MLRQVAAGVLVHQSELIENNAVVVQGRTGVLLIDPGVTGDELACLANDLRELRQPVVAGFATHPDWDHALWHAELGDAPRYGTARCAASLHDLLSNADWEAQVAEGLPPEIAGDIPLELFGRITGLPAGAAQDRAGSGVRARIARRRCPQRPADRPVGEARLGVGQRRAQRASPATRRKNRTRRDARLSTRHASAGHRRSRPGSSGHLDNSSMVS